MPRIKLFIPFGRLIVLIQQAGVDVAGLSCIGPFSSASRHTTLLCTQEAFGAEAPGKGTQPLSPYNVLLNMLRLQTLKRLHTINNKQPVDVSLLPCLFVCLCFVYNLFISSHRFKRSETHPCCHLVFY